MMTEISSLKAKCLDSFSTVDQGIQQVYELLRSTQSESYQLRQEVHRLREQVQNLKSEGQSREAVMARLEKDLAWRDSQLAELSGQAPKGERAAHTAGEDLRQAQETIDQLQADLERASQTIAQNEEVIQFKARHIEHLESRRAGTSSDLENSSSPSEEEWRAAIRTRDLDLERMKRALETKQENLQRLTQEREEIRVRIVKILSTI